MANTYSAEALVHVSIAAPRELIATGSARVDVYLRQGADSRYRWHHADGKPTVVDGASVEHALRVAQMVWRDVRIVARADDVAPT